jgi:hypothetical protein
MRILGYILSVFLLIGSAYGYDLEAGRRLGLAGGIMLSEPQAADLLACPVALIESNQILAEAGYRRLYELSELDKVYLAGGYRTGNFTFGLGFSQFGQRNYYVEQVVRGTAAYRYSHFSGGVLMSAKLLDIDKDERKVSLSAASVGLAAGVYYKSYYLGIAADNLNRPRLDDNRDPERMTLNLYGQVKGMTAFSVTGRVFWEEDEKAIFSIGQYFHLPGDNAVFVGVQSDPLSYGGGIDISYAGFGITYAVAHHPVLGFTHNVSLTFSYSGDSER